MTANNAPLSVKLFDLLAAHYGNPLPGHQEQEIRAAVAKLAGTAAQHQAVRELIEHDATVWERLRAAPAGKGAH